MKSESEITQSCLTLYDPMDYTNSPGQNARVGSLSLRQGIFPTQELKWALLHSRQILYQLRYQGSQLLNLKSLKVLKENAGVGSGVEEWVMAARSFAAAAALGAAEPQRRPGAGESRPFSAAGDPPSRQALARLGGFS